MRSVWRLRACSESDRWEIQALHWLWWLPPMAVMEKVLYRTFLMRGSRTYQDSWGLLHNQRLETVPCHEGSVDDSMEEGRGTIGAVGHWKRTVQC